MSLDLYFDHNATSPLKPEARAAILEAFDLGNPLSPHKVGRAAAAVVDRARGQMGELVGRDPRCVYFTSGATEGNAWTLNALKTESKPYVIASAVEHPSVLCWATHTVGVGKHGVIDLGELEALCSKFGPKVGAVSVMAANNETGVLQPVSEVHRIANKYDIPLHSDCTQLPGRLPIKGICGEVLTFSAHKFGGPQGVGAVITDLDLAPYLKGGSQERGKRAGTHNVAGIAGMGAAAGVATALSSGRRDQLEAACVDLGGVVIGSGADRLPNTTFVRFPVPGDLVVMALDLKGISASTGSACGSGATQSSHVLAAMGIEGTPVRFSLDAQSDVGPVISALEEIVPRMQGCVS